MSKNKISEADLRRIRQNLPHKSQSVIVEKTGLSGTTVSKTLNGHSYNYKVIEAAYQIIEEERAKIAELTKSLDAILK